MSSTKPTQETQSILILAQRLFPTMNSGNDDLFFGQIHEEYSHLINIAQQLKLFHAWCLDQQPNNIKNPRFRFRSWLENAVEYKSRSRVKTSPSLHSKKSEPRLE